MNAFDELVDVMQLLREKCPWDKAQTHERLKVCLIEECYEVISAIDDKKAMHLKEELGDILIQVILHSLIASESHDFTLTDVITAVKDKMIERHPHVFGDQQALSIDAVYAQWHQQKKTHKNPFESIPPTLPSLMKAVKIQQRHADYAKQSTDTILDNMTNSVQQLQQQTRDQSEKQDGFARTVGDVLFHVAALCRNHDLDPEQALQATNKQVMASLVYDGDRS